GINQDISDILSVADLVVAFADLKEWIVCGACRVGRIKQEYGAETGAPTGCELKILALDVVNDRGARPGQQSWNDEADPLAGARRSKQQHMPGAIGREIVAAKAADHDALVSKKPRAPHLPRIRPAG